MTSDNRSLYQDAGVDVEKGDALVGWLQDTQNDSVDTSLGHAVAGIGGFSALFKPNFTGMKEPILVSSTDGVGTKVLLGIEKDQLDGLGRDLVGMCVNDLYTIGGRPLFFLDYFATGELGDAQFKSILSGIRAGLAETGAALLGGETAELPGLYAKGHFDLAGFVVGVVDGAQKIDGSDVKAGDQIFGIASSGFHSNGYSLIRKWLKEKPASEEMVSNLLQPTKIYSELPKILSDLPASSVSALAHITGGGISGNLPRVLPQGVDAHLDWAAIKTPSWMTDFIKSNTTGRYAVEGVFNLGLGMMACVRPSVAGHFQEAAQEIGLDCFQVGEVKAAANSEAKADVIYHNLNKED